MREKTQILSLEAGFPHAPVDAYATEVLTKLVANWMTCKLVGGFNFVSYRHYIVIAL